MGAKLDALGMLSGLGRRKPTPEEEIAATLRTKERVMVDEMEINPALAKQVNDGEISLAEAQRISANQNRKLGVGKEQAVMDDHAVISSIRGADPDGIKLFEWKQGLPQKQRAAVTSAEIEYKKGNPKPLAQLYRVMGVTAVVGAGSAGAEAGPISGIARLRRSNSERKFVQDEVNGAREAELVENLGRDYAPTYTPSADDVERSQYEMWLRREREQEIIDNNPAGPDVDWRRRGVGATAAATAASAGFASEDAEAGPLRLMGSLTPDLAGRQLKNRLNKERQKGISPGNTATDYVHRNSNYDNGFLSSIKKSGEAYGGPRYVSGVKEFAQEIFESTDDPAVKSAIMDWAKPRVARGGQVAALAGGANRAAANGGEPQEQSMIASVLDKMEQLELIPDERTRTIGMEMLKREFDKAIEFTQMSAQGLWGTGRGLFGLATGEEPVDTRRAMREVYAAPPEENLERAGQYVLKETGSPAAAAATSTLGMLTDPSYWLL